MVQENEIMYYYYYDSHPTEKDLIGQPSAHSECIFFFGKVLRALFRGQCCTIYQHLNFYHTSDPLEYPLEPDLAVIKGVDPQSVRSWRVGENGPAPQVVFEIGSSETWQWDLEEMPALYARMGVQEYFAYDPHKRLLPKPKIYRRQKGRRLFGWRLDPASEEMRELPPGPDGSLWSIHLESLLVPDGYYLRLYNNRGQRRLTREEAEAEQADAEKRRADALAEKLRSLGIDPDQL